MKKKNHGGEKQNTAKEWSQLYSIPETNSKFAPENRANPKRTPKSISNHPFPGANLLLVSRRVLELAKMDGFLMFPIGFEKLPQESMVFLEVEKWMGKTGVIFAWEATKSKAWMSISKQFSAFHEKKKTAKKNGMENIKVSRCNHWTQQRYTLVS